MAGGRLLLRGRLSTPAPGGSATSGDGRTGTPAPVSAAGLACGLGAPPSDPRGRRAAAAWTRAGTGRRLRGRARLTGCKTQAAPTRPPPQPCTGPYGSPSVLRPPAHAPTP